MGVGSVTTTFGADPSCTRRGEGRVRSRSRPVKKYHHCPRETVPMDRDTKYVITFITILLPVTYVYYVRAGNEIIKG